MGTRKLTIGDRVFIMRDGVFEKLERKESKVVRFTDRANADYSLSAPPVKRGLFYILCIFITFKWIFFAILFPFKMFAVAAIESLSGILLCLKEIPKDIKSRLY